MGRKRSRSRSAERDDRNRRRHHSTRTRASDRRHPCESAPRSRSRERACVREQSGAKACDSSRPATALPIAAHRQELLAALAAHQVVICIGETGSGKTTQLPQYLHAAGYTANGQRVGVTQPRRVATVAVAQRVADELGSRVDAQDGVVGYAIRFDDHTREATRIKFMTDGILVRETLKDPELAQYSVLMLDEAHERSIHTDILVGLLKDIVRRRRNLKVLITSATLDAAKFVAFFGGATRVVRVPGRSFPVDILHTKQRQVMGPHGPVSTYVRSAVETALQVHNSEPMGHVLVFLTGQKEIEDACSQIEALHRQQRAEARGQGRDDRGTEQDCELRVLPLFGALHGRLQHAIFDRVAANVRKVIVATNIAETSLTVDGVRYVIDCGFTKQKVYNPMAHMESLVVVPVSKVSAQQRAGRAGRTAAGKCFRLYSKDSYAAMMEETVPEIQRTNLANTVLYLKILGIHDVVGFQYIDPPAEDALLDALRQLYELGALDEHGKATALGRLMSEFPLEPKLARSLVEAMKLNCGRETTSIVAMMSVENVFVDRPKKRRDRRGNQRSDRSDDGDDDRSDDSRGNRADARFEMLQEDGLVDDYGDQLTYLRILDEFERQRKHRREKQWCDDRHLQVRALSMAIAVKDQLNIIRRAISRNGFDRWKAETATGHDGMQLPTMQRVRKALCAGFFPHAVRRCTAQSVYRPFHHDGPGGSEFKLLHFHPLSTLNYSPPPEYCVYHELVQTSKPFMRHALAVDIKWIREYADDRMNASTQDLYRLCGRTAPAEEIRMSAAEVNSGAVSPQAKHQRTQEAPTKLSDDSVAAARARFLQRKRRA
ncbi:TPA: hypothetical protein N0F65_007635 [Lagenidium giganteum]|uniref:RNA helicase n=1 Tax=Lagenidium giganteum TaxID=4803 RepID=A0AAV2ZCA1_9STRA|nr:TPA: hypothetical protein N0F65_007635 [Lagenidium giganteum]